MSKKAPSEYFTDKVHKILPILLNFFPVDIQNTQQKLAQRADQLLL